MFACFCAPSQVFAVYQALPGPEATELCCYFGQISNGRIGGLLGGLAFCLPGAAQRHSATFRHAASTPLTFVCVCTPPTTPGFCIMLLFSYLYKQFSLFESPGFLASFHAVRCALAAPALLQPHTCVARVR
jgi:hypothetical protein